MTLSTDIYILDEVDPLQVFQFCQRLLTKYDEPHHRTPDQQKVRHEQDGGWKPLAAGTFIGEEQRSYQGRDGTTYVWTPEPGRPWSRDNQVDQGLPAWLMTAYRPDGPLRAEDPGHDKYCDDDCTGEYHDRVCWMTVDFDTVYSYRDVRGWGCGDLHAAMVSELGAWLTSKGVRWEWRNEFTGEVHIGPDGLSELGAAGAEAQNWFATTVAPAIVMHTATSGGGQLELGGVVLDVPDLSGGVS